MRPRVALPSEVPPEEARAAAALESATASASATASDSATEPRLERSQWERLSLGSNLELHIRRPLSRPEQRRVERLITIARQVLNEEMP
jgi:hypothetical protein